MTMWADRELQKGDAGVAALILVGWAVVCIVALALL